MKHIRYISDNKTICEKPTRLGHDFVVLDTSSDPDEDSCHVCSDLLFAHNLEEYKRESRTTVFHNPPPPLEDPLAPSRGFLIGLAVSSAFWLVVLVLFWSVFN